MSRISRIASIPVCIVFLLVAGKAPAQSNLELFKTIPPLDASTPEWAVLMYSERPDVWKVDSLYDDYYRVHRFEKTTHTQNYKHWRRLITQNEWQDEQGNLSIPDMDDEIAFNTSWLKQRESRHQNRSVMSGNWEPVGPFETWNGDQWISKQVNVYTIDQSVSHPNIIFCGTETGGVFRSVDKGSSWTSVADGLILGGIGSVKIHPSNPDTVYLGQGHYLWRSDDGGDSWTTVLAVSSLNVRDILFVPATGANHMIVLIATQQGLLRSSDGGTTWFYISSEQTWDLELRPGSLDTVYALETNSAAQHIRFFRSHDKGQTFTEYNTGWYPGSGTYNNSTRGARMAVTPADPDYVYVALLGYDIDDNDNNWIGVYKSTDGGTSWSLPAGEIGGPYSESHYCLTSFHPWFEWGGLYNQGYYDLGIAVSATDPELVLVGSLNLFMSTDGAATYTGIGGYFGSISGYSHPDIQEIEINSQDVWVASDGGIDKYTADITSKVSLNNGINGSDYWGYDIGWNKEIMVGGRYHNGNDILYENYPVGKSRNIGGGEAPTGYVNQGFPHKVYHSDVGGKLVPQSLNDAVQNIANLGKYPNQSYVNENKGELEADPRCYNHLYLTADNGFWKSTDGGTTFEMIDSFGVATEKTTRFEISRSNPDIIYVCQKVSGASKLWKTIDGGNTWNSLTLPTSQTSNGLFISLSPTDPDELYLATSYGGSNTTKVYKTTNGGGNWTNLTTTTLNGHHIEDIFYAAGSNGGVYVATNYTVFYRNNEMADWEIMDTGLPARVQTMLMKPFYREGELRLATNRGIWKSPLFDDFDPIVQPTVDKLHSNCSRDTFYFEDYSIVNHDGASWEWAFTPAPQYVNALNTRNPKIVFGQNGEYDVSLTITVDGTDYSKTIADMVSVESVCEPDTFPGNAIRTFEDGDGFLAQNVNLTNITHFTVTGWWKPLDTLRGFGALWSSGDWCAHCDYTEGLIVDYWGSRVWYKWPGNAANWGSNSGMYIPMNEWSYVALVIEPTGATMYLNEDKYVHNIPLNPGEIQNFYVGFGHYNRSFYGQIDDVTLWTRALSESEIRALRHLTKEDVVPMDPDLIAYYQFNTLVDGQILDRGGVYHGSLIEGSLLEISRAPIGGGASATMAVNSGGVVDFPGTGVTMDFPDSGTYPNGNVVVSRINLPPDMSAYDPPATDSTYWIINNYGTNTTFTELDGITFSGFEELNPDIPEVYSMFKRPTYAEGDTWGDIMDIADSVTTTSLSFTEDNGITAFSQFAFGSDENCVTVSNTNDSGPGSLRSAISCARPDGHVVFAPDIDGDTIQMTSTIIDFDKNITLLGRGVNNTIVNGSAQNSLFNILNGNTVRFESMSLIGGSASSGRILFNQGELTMYHLLLYDHPTLPNNDNSLIENVPGGVMTIEENVQIQD